mmetsp:Transcript_123834/g.194240  ORF Transcript_123834/g.194240 Transcript_123834/m.194240 type:complete len:147 (-) Transcript_123834:97-537(-)
MYASRARARFSLVGCQPLPKPASMEPCNVEDCWLPDSKTASNRDVERNELDNSFRWMSIGDGWESPMSVSALLVPRPVDFSPSPIASQVQQTQISDTMEYSVPNEALGRRTAAITISRTGSSFSNDFEDLRGWLEQQNSRQSHFSA